MSNTYSKLLVQIVIAVKGRNSLIKPGWEENLYRYITGIVKNKGQRLIAVNGMPDHVHILIGMRPNCCISDLVRDIKKSTNSFITSSKFVSGKFQWQTGYGAFSYHNALLGVVTSYVRNQKQHHAYTTFESEYRKLLAEFKIDYSEEYLFEWLE